MSYEQWNPIAVDYDPIKVASIDATDTQPHDKALIRALKSKYTPDPNIESDSKCVIFVARLDCNTNEQTLQKFFSKYGSIVSLRLVRDIVTGFSKRYAFIEYKDRRTAKKVYEQTNNAIIDGRKILVDYECERTMSGWKPRRLGGGFGGKKESGQLRFGCRDRPWKRPIRLSTSYGDRGRDEGHSSKSLKVYDKRVERSERNEKNESHNQSRYHHYHHDDREYDSRRQKK